MNLKTSHIFPALTLAALLWLITGCASVDSTTISGSDTVTTNGFLHDAEPPAAKSQHPKETEQSKQLKNRKLRTLKRQAEMAEKMAERKKKKHTQEQKDYRSCI